MLQKTPHALAAATANYLAEMYGRASWCTGIGVVRDPAEGFVVAIRVAPNSDRPSMPSRLNGVAVQVTEAPMARAWGGR